MELRFDSILYSKLVTKILMQVISNDHTGPQVTHPWPTEWYIWYTGNVKLTLAYLADTYIAIPVERVVGIIFLVSNAKNKTFILIYQ